MSYPEDVISQSRHFFDQAYLHFEKSLLKHPPLLFYYKLGDLIFCLKFAGQSLLHRLTRALNHLAIKPVDQCDLTICIWDSQSTGLSPLQFPWRTHEYDLRGEVIRYNSDEINTVVDIHTKALNLFHKQKKIALFWVNNAEELPWWVEGSPFQLILHWWSRLYDHQLTHAAAIGFSEGGVLLTGKSGSGKSTTTLACMQGGMKYLSEDYCLIRKASPVTAYSVYNSAKISNQTLSWFPELKHHISNPHRKEDEKAFLFHQEYNSQHLLLRCPLKALLTLKIAHRSDSFLEPIESREALPSLSISTLWQLTHSGPSVFLHLKTIAEALPCYRLHLGTDLKKIPTLIEDLL